MAKDDRGNTYTSEAQSKAQANRAGLKQDQAEAREMRRKARDERTDEQQLAILDKMFGEGKGATRERTRLLKRIRERKEKAPAKKEKVEKEE